MQIKAVDPQQAATANMAFTGSACENVHKRALLCDDDGRGKSGRIDRCRLPSAYEFTSSSLPAHFANLGFKQL